MLLTNFLVYRIALATGISDHECYTEQELQGTWESIDTIQITELKFGQRIYILSVSAQRRRNGIHLSIKLDQQNRSILFPFTNTRESISANVRNTKESAFYLGRCSSFYTDPRIGFFSLMASLLTRKLSNSCNYTHRLKRFTPPKLNSGNY